MTLTEGGEPVENTEANEPSVVEIGSVLTEVLKQGRDQERLTFGVFECAEVLETCPEHVMLCVLPNIDSADVLISIQHKLIEAHCWENAVNLMKVDSSDKLMSILLTPDAKKNSMHRALDFSCLLIAFPVEEMSSEDFQITKYSYLFHETEMEAIPLPD